MKQAENRLSRFEAEVENLNKVRKEYENVKNTGKTFFYSFCFLFWGFPE